MPRNTIRENNIQMLHKHPNSSSNIHYLVKCNINTFSTFISLTPFSPFSKPITQEGDTRKTRMMYITEICFFSIGSITIQGILAYFQDTAPCYVKMHSMGFIALDQ